jgi:hypothetical protein
MVKYKKAQWVNFLHSHGGSKKGNHKSFGALKPKFIVKPCYLWAV